jgi:hypothetical protein
VGGFFVWSIGMAAALPAARDRARLLYTTTQMSLIDIAVEAGVWDRTVHRWVKQGGWERPSGGTQRPPKIPPDTLEPARRLFESGANVGDLALLIGCDKAYLYNFAKKCRWTRPAAKKPAAPPKSDEIAAVEAVLRDPAATRGDVIRALERAIALTGADALGGDAPAGRVTALGKLAELARAMPADVAPAPSDPDHFPDANELIEEIARRFEEFCAIDEARELRLWQDGFSEEEIARRMRGDRRD